MRGVSYGVEYAKFRVLSFKNKLIVYGLECMEPCTFPAVAQIWHLLLVSLCLGYQGGIFRLNPHDYGLPLGEDVEKEIIPLSATEGLDSRPLTERSIHWWEKQSDCSLLGDMVAYFACGIS